MARLFGYVDVTDSGFIVAVLSIAFNPLFWNVVRAACAPATPSFFCLPLPATGRSPLASVGGKTSFGEVCWAGWGEQC